MIEITPAARSRIDSLVAAEAVREPALRIGADGDPKSPIARSYAISLVEKDERERTEIAINVDGIRIFLNLDTSHLLSGATVDWGGENGGGAFVIREKDQAPAAASAAPDAPPAAEFSDPVARRIQEVIITDINPRIASHGGHVEMVDLQDDVLYIRMGGGCQGCAASAATLRMGVERMIREAVPEIAGLVDVTDHSAGVNPYY
jgi:Fe/S biogenesis protein NfuA